MSFVILRQFVSIPTIVPLLKRSRSENKMNIFTQTRNPITGATEWEVQHDDYDYHQEIARSAFADMLHDTERNKKYNKALKIAIDTMHAAGKPANVLDIGTGTGLLSIMAAQAGADSIVACEAFKPMADCCKKILSHNGVDNLITVIPKRSTQLTVGEDGDMKQKANILVTEVFDTELIGEGAISTFSHAHQYLLEKDCIVVPDSAVIYAQVVECSDMQKWNKLHDWKNEVLRINLKTPQKIKDCAGSAAVHDLQLSQLSRPTFKELSDPIPVFHYDWSGNTELEKNRRQKHTFKAIASGHAQMVFMWWDLNMDTAGKIVLSCAPWWLHPAANVTSEYPQDTVPWRDHWMQAIYYLPQTLPVKAYTEYTLTSCQDEYSLWFYAEDEINKPKDYVRPICECGVHMALSRTHVAYLNNTERIVMYLTEIRKVMKEMYNPTVLDLNGGSLLGLATAQMGAKTVYILEKDKFLLNIQRDYIKENNIQNVKFVSEVTGDLVKDINIITCDPNFSNSILPWENLKMAHILLQVKDSFRHDVAILPHKCELYAMPVEFIDLHKIRIPLGKCEGIDMRLFDQLVESSRAISDCDLEPQPLWEYPCYCRGDVHKLLEVDMLDLRTTYTGNTQLRIAQGDHGNLKINGFVVWAVWHVGLGGLQHSTGALQTPRVGDRVRWDPHSRQGVKILKSTHNVHSSDKMAFQIACDIASGHFNLTLDLVYSPQKAGSRIQDLSMSKFIPVVRL